MKIAEQGTLLRIFIGESDRWHHQPLYEAIVLKARELGLKVFARRANSICKTEWRASSAEP